MTSAARRRLPPLLLCCAAASRSRSRGGAGGVASAWSLPRPRPRLRRLLWPGLDKGYDPAFEAPPPVVAPGPGCPFLGHNILKGSKAKGPEYFYREASAAVGHPGIWRFYFLGNSVISVSGGENVDAVLKGREYNIASFDSWQGGGEGDDEVGNEAKSRKRKRRKKKKASLLSSSSVMFESDRRRHRYLRRVMGEAFAPASVRAGTDNLVRSAHEQIKHVLPGQTVKMEDLCKRFALDVAWRQIVGLDLEGNEDEAERFQKAAETFVSGIFNPVAFLNVPWKTWTAPYRARRYLAARIEEKIDELEERGEPDGTTLGAMVYSSDGETGERLSREDVVDNTLILLVAGTETTANTLTTAVLLLGLHPEAFERLATEQRALVEQHGAEDSFRHLEECPYLDAVVRETMRLYPVSGTNLRRNVSGRTLVLDGRQVPPNASVFPNVRLTHELDPKAKHRMDPLSDFDPDRWLDAATRPDEDYLPFGAGERRCLGASLATAEMRIFVASFVHRARAFELLGDGGRDRPELRWKPATIIPVPADGVPIRVELR